jgi:hypothetical protein
MVKRLAVWSLVGIGMVAAAGAARRFLAPRTGSTRSSGIPTIGGDTWPPVPLNPDRQA